MKKNVAILTDTNSGITIQEAKDFGIYLILMPVLIDGEVFLEEKEINKETFYQKMEAGADITTSQPSPGDILDMFDTLLKEYEEVVYIPMSAGLSGTYETAAMLAGDYDGRVHVVNNQRISATMKASVFDAMKLVEEGKTGLQVKEYLEEDALNAPIFIMVDTLKYLKKGGRVTAAGAAIGTALHIKPVLKIDGGKLDAFAKVRGSKQAIKTMLKAIEEERDHRLKGKKIYINGAYSGGEEVGELLKKELEEHFTDMEISVCSLPMSISTHVGPGAMGIGIYTRYE